MSDMVDYHVILTCQRKASNGESHVFTHADVYEFPGDTPENALLTSVINDVAHIKNLTDQSGWVILFYRVAPNWGVKPQTEFITA